MTTKPKANLPLILRGKRWYLRKTFEGKQRDIPLATDNLKTAESRATRFLATAEVNGYEAAMIQLKGGKPLLKGDSPSLAQISELYREFCLQSPKPPRDSTIDYNLARLECLMTRNGATTIGKLNRATLFQDFLGGKTATQSSKRTFASAVKAAQSVFKKSALAFYQSKGHKIANPFEGLELAPPKVTQFVPPPDAVIADIWENVDKERPAVEAMIVLLALGAGLRRSEIEAITPADFQEHSDRVIITIGESADFTPKAGQTGFVPITTDLYKRLRKLRGKSTSPFFVPGKSAKTGKGRLWERIKGINAWLKTKGITDRKPLHALRKTAGSLVAKDQGILAAAKLLRNTPQVAMTSYLGVAQLGTVDIPGGKTPDKSPAEQLAAQLGISVEELMARLAK